MYLFLFSPEVAVGDGREQESVEDEMEDVLVGEEGLAHKSSSRTNRSYTIDFKVKAVEWHRLYGENWSQSAR